MSNLTIPKRALGRTGESLSIIGMGGIVLLGGDSENAERVVGRAIERGVNYFDVAPSYGNGEAEELLGVGLIPYRNDIFLACKTGARDRDGARGEMETSLKRLRTDHLDLYQMHGLTSIEETRQALGPGGAIETFIEARENGLTGFIGFSAHTEEAALLAMELFDFDTVLFPINCVCWLNGGFGPAVVQKAHEKRMGILALKTMARGPWPPDAERKYTKCWYQPVDDPHEAEMAIRFTLSQPVTAAIPPGEEQLFELALSIAERFTPLADEEQAGMASVLQGMPPLFSKP